jgi:hypothetical protein
MMNERDLTKLMFSLSGIPAGAGTGIVIDLLIQILTDDESLLGQIDKNIKKIVRGHFQAGKNYLLETQRLHSDELQREFVKKALDQFMMAVAVDEPIIVAKSQFFIGVCYSILNEEQSAKHWMEVACETAIEYETKLREEYEKREKVSLIDFAMFLTGATFWIPAVRYYRTGKRLATSLDELYQFMRPLSEYFDSTGIKVNGLKPARELVVPTLLAKEFLVEQEKEIKK